MGEEVGRGSNMTVDSAANVPQAIRNNFLDEVVSVEKTAWPPELQASKEKFASRLQVFPEGFFAIKVDGVVKGVTTSQMITYDELSRRSWDEITDGGTITNTHIPEGDALYVVSVGVAADAQGMGIGGKLVEAQKKLAKERGLKYLFLGARVPGYDAYCKEYGEITVEDYLKTKNKKEESVDPEIRFYERQGLHPAKIIPNFEPDKQSRDYGVVMLWENPQAS